MTFCSDLHSNTSTATIGFAETVEQLRDRTAGDVLTPGRRRLHAAAPR